MLRFRFYGLRICTCRKGVITQEDQDSRRHDSAGDPSPARLENAACHGTRDQSYYWGRTRKETRGAPLPPCRETAPGRLLSRAPPARTRSPHAAQSPRLASLRASALRSRLGGGGRASQETNVLPPIAQRMSNHPWHAANPRFRVPERASPTGLQERGFDETPDQLPRAVSGQRGRAPPDLLSGVRPRAVDSTPSKEEKGSRGGTSPVRRTPGL